VALILPFDGKYPRIGARVFLAPNATIIGDVEIGDDASVWFGAVLRGDMGPIRVGARTNVQDVACLHMTDGVSECVVGDEVTIGHGAILHGCRVGDGCLVGMGSVLLDNCVIGAGSVVAAGSLVPPRAVYPEGSLVRGSPARLHRAVDEAEGRMGRDGAARYLVAARAYLDVCGDGAGGGER
jgi:carbonic anhydrase/acetyltransferase-like protein (isoleucine patch superfamily)